MLRSGRKKRTFAELVAWQRGRQPYNDFDEKDAFQGFDLVSMRVVANRELDKAIGELKYGLPKALIEIAENPNSNPEQSLLDTMHEIAFAKAHATKRCYLERLVKLAELEALILPHIFEGSCLESERGRLTLELAQAKANILLAQEIAYFRTEYLDKVITARTKKGGLDQKLISTYLASDFANRDFTGYPPLLWSNKSLLDEVFNSLSGNIRVASQMTRRVCERDAAEHFLSPTERTKRLKMLFDQCTELGDQEGGLEVLRNFEASDPEAPATRSIYLIRYLVMLLDYALIRNNHDTLMAAVAIYERNEHFVLQSEIGGNRSRILICMMLAYLGMQDVNKATAISHELLRAKDQKTPLLYRITQRVCHLMILFDLKEVEQHLHYARNYRGLMIKQGGFALPAFTLLNFLRKNCKKFAEIRPTKNQRKGLQNAVEEIQNKLMAFLATDGAERRLFYEPILKWLSAKK